MIESKRRSLALFTLCTLVVASFAAAGCAKSSDPSARATVVSDGHGEELAVGAAAPDFDAQGHSGERVHLADLKGHPVVLYFYPKDETPGCTKEACAFRDAWDKLRAKNATLIGVSSDTGESHKKFAENHKLPFVLVSDPDGAVAKAYGVPVRLGGFDARQTFVIDPEGKIKKIYRDVDVAVHAQQILDDLP